MEVKELRCPECGAKIESDEKVSFCSHCGTKLFFDDGTRTINYNYKTEDVAKIKEIELNREREKIEQNSRFVDKKFLLGVLLCVILNFILFMFSIFGKKFLLSALLFLIFYIILCVSIYNSSKSQEKKLQEIVNEIYTDISSKNYEVALIKAKSLRYTVKWSKDIKEKWDDTRESLIKIIEEKMK